MMIEVHDNKGFYWELIPNLPFILSDTGLVEVWCTVVVGFPPMLGSYQQIPLPVFTDWWPT